MCFNLGSKSQARHSRVAQMFTLDVTFVFTSHRACACTGMTFTQEEEERGEKKQNKTLHYYNLTACTAKPFMSISAA